MLVALVYPPTCDPTAPYLSVPTLTAWLRRAGVEVVPVDANLEAWEHLLRREQLDRVALRVEERLHELDARATLSHAEQLDYAALWSARGDARAAPGAIGAALATLRDPERFYDVGAYAAAVATVSAAQRAIAAAYAPLALDFATYRTPFSLLSAEEIAADARPERDPFHAYLAMLADRLREQGAGLIGISVAFPGQMQPAYSLAFALRARHPKAHVVAGGPAMTQRLQRLDGERLTRALGPFHAAVVGEGEIALEAMVRAVERGEHPAGVVRGTEIEDLSVLPPPDFAGLPIDRALAPEPVLPYDPSRGCYWGACTFCHYGLAELGTARHRERPVEAVLDHLALMQRAHGARVFYFSQDVLSPRLAVAIARGVEERGLRVRWGSDMRPEKALTRERCRTLAAGGALQLALGVESASPRVLKLIDKGIPVGDVRRAIVNLAAAGIAVEAMCFSDFPTETFREARETLQLVRDLREHLALFILGRFHLTHGTLVAKRPAEFGLADVWGVRGDELGTSLFWAERTKSKRPSELEKLDAAVGELSERWILRRYPWAGALSTAHSMLYYARFGPDVFRRGPRVSGRVPGARARSERARFDVEEVARVSAENEARIWETLTSELRHVGRAPYGRLAVQIAPALRSAGTWRTLAGRQPVRAPTSAAHVAGARGAKGPL